MAEQYIYSRAEKGFINALNQTVPVGFGFMALSPGMNNALKDAVRNHCQDCPRPSRLDGQGVPLPLLRKVCLPKGQTLLQKSAWIVGEGRDFPVSHGYVLEDGELREYGPEAWFDALFRLGNPNTGMNAIPLESRLESAGESFRAKSLKETMEILGFRRPCFCQMLLACFDALASRRQVLAVWDFDRPGERELRRSVLYWLYTCLPCGLWRSLGFDSIYTEMSSPGQIQFSFVDKALVQPGSQTPNIQVGSQLRPLGGNFLIQDGTVIHNDSKYPTHWYGKNSVYARWLEQLVNTLWECPEEKLPSVLQALSEFRWSFQKLLSIREEQLEPQWYDAVCVKMLGSAPQALAEACEQVRNSITEDELYDFRLAFMGAFTEAERREILTDLLQTCKKSSAPVGEKDIRMLCGLFENGLNAPAAGAAGAFAAREASAPGAKITEVLDRYQEMLPPSLYQMLLERVFFSEGYQEDAPLWTDCGVDSSETAAKRRRDAWIAEKIPEDKPVWELPASISQALAELKGLSGQQQAEFWQELFQNRCWAISGKDLSAFADEQAPQRLQELEQELSVLLGSVPKDALDILQQKAYDQLLSAPAPFMDSRWLHTALNGRKTGGEAGEILEILSVFADGGSGGWKRCYKGRSKAAQNKAFSALSRMFLNGTLPEIQSEMIISFLFLNPEDTQRILLQAAGQGGGRLLLELLRGTRKYPWKYRGGLGSGALTIFHEITEFISKDREIADKLREKDGGCTPFYKDMLTFLQEPETKKMLLPYDLSAAVNNVQHLSSAGDEGKRWGMRRK